MKKEIEISYSKYENNYLYKIYIRSGMEIGTLIDNF